MGYKFVYIIFFSKLVFCQTFEVSYEYELKESIWDDKKNVSAYFKTMFYQSRKDIKHYPMEFLVSNKGYSIDFSQSMQVDPEFQKIRVPKRLAISHLGLDIKLYNDHNKTYSYNGNDLIKSFNLLELGYWKITKQNKKILGYSCYKAYYNTDESELKNASILIPKYAWFTTEIPMQGGPTIFGNLPGLILELETKAAHFISTSIQETSKELTKIDFTNKKVMTFIESQKYYGNIMESKIKN